MFSTSNQIISKETAAVVGMGSNDAVKIPIPDEKTRKALEAMGVVFGAKVDRVLIGATLPSGWRIVATGADARHRVLKDDTSAKIAYIFLKNSGYDYYGSMSLCS